MADGIIEILTKKRLKAKRNLRNIFSFSFENNSSFKREAELFSNKTGFSARSTISSFKDTEVYGWVNDWSNAGDVAGRLAGIVFNHTINKTIVFHLNNAGTRVKIYEVSNDFSYSLKGTFSFGGVLTSPIQVIYSKNIGNYYIVGKGASDRLSAQIITDNYVLGNYQIWSSQGVILGQLGVKENFSNLNANRVFFTSKTIGTTMGRLTIINPVNNSQVNIDILNVDMSSDFSVVFDEATKVYFILLKELSGYTKLLSIQDNDANSNSAINIIKNYPLDIKGTIFINGGFTLGNQSSSSVVNNRKLFLTGIDENNNGFLDKFDIHSSAPDYPLISTSFLENKTGSQNLFVFTDINNNFYLTNGSVLAGYDVDGKIILRYNANSRSNIISGGASTFLTGTHNRVDSDQFFNPSNNTFSFNSTYSEGGISVFNPTFTGGLTGFNLPTSAGDYNMALIEFNTQPIKISEMLIYYKNGGNSQNNIIKYLEETSTGKSKQKLIQPRNYITADSSDDKSIEIEFDTPIILDTAHFFKMDVEANETITMVLFYEQAEAIDILKNKVLG